MACTPERQMENDYRLGVYDTLFDHAWAKQVLDSSAQKLQQALNDIAKESKDGQDELHRLEAHLARADCESTDAGATCFSWGCFAALAGLMYRSRPHLHVSS